jgi:hypothetical protein
MVASLRGSVCTGAKGDESSTGRVGCWISPRYGPFSLGARFETYGPFISLIFRIRFLGRGQPRITETADTAVHIHTHTHTHTVAKVP